MKSNRRLFAALTAILLLGAVVGALLLTDTPIRAFAQDITGAEEADDAAEDEAEGEDTPITNERAREQASQAALDYVGEGRVSDTEVGDEEGYYEIEITLDSGRQVDVHLDENFNVLGREDDGVDDEE